MKRVVLVLLVAAVAGVFFANYRITSEVEEQLETSKRALTMFGDFSWQDVSVSPMGAVSVTGLRFRPHGLEEDYRVDEVRFETAHLLELYRIAFELDQREIPDEMHMVVSGLRIDLDSNLFRDMEAGAAGQSNLLSRLVTAGCGDRHYFSVDDYIAMGYGESVSDMTLGYRMSHSGTRMNLDLDLVSRGMVRVATDMAVDLNPTAAFNAETVSDAKVSRVKVAITDAGLNDRRHDFCAGEAGVARGAYPEHHLQAWMDQWQRQGLQPGDALVEAWRRFSAGTSDTLVLAIDPYPSLDANDRAISADPSYLSGRLNPTVAVAGQDPTSFSISSVEPLVEAVARQDAQTNEPQVSDPLDISRRLHEHLNRDVRLVLTDGSRIEGRIKAIRNGRLQLNRRLHGGHMVVPIPLARVQSAHLAVD